MIPRDATSNDPDRSGKRSRQKKSYTIQGYTMAQLIEKYPSNMDPQDIQTLKNRKDAYEAEAIEAELTTFKKGTFVFDEQAETPKKKEEKKEEATKLNGDAKHSKFLLKRTSKKHPPPQTLSNGAPIQSFSICFHSFIDPIYYEKNYEISCCTLFPLFFMLNPNISNQNAHISHAECNVVANSQNAPHLIHFD